MSVGLGIKIPSPEKVNKSVETLRRDHVLLHTSASQITSKKVAYDLSGLSGTTRGLQPTLRSASSMRGLLLAEVGDAMVELDICGEGSGFRQGQRISFDNSPFPGGGSKHDASPQVLEEAQAALSRHGTLLSAGANPGRTAAELKSILGNSSARLKPGAALLAASGQSSQDEERTVFEQAKPRARVDLDIILASNTCVQGGYLQGHLKIRIRSPSNKESSVKISDGKVRVIGFECMSNEHERYPFYQCSALLSAVTSTSESLYGYPSDAEGFAPAIEGVHTLPFSMHLPCSTENGVPKGVLPTQTGVSVRYIAMASIKVKDPDTGKRSIAHFYRNCELWPRLNPAIILAPAVNPLWMTTSKRLFMGGTGKVTLRASLHRLHWIAGQQCCVKVSVMNATKKAIKSLTLTLVRSTVIFKPDARLDALNDSHNLDPDACQTSTTQKVVTESVLELGQRGARGHASAKGWWTGVGPGEYTEFSYFIQLPSNALTITRSRLLEIDYSLRVTLSAGTLRTADVQVTLPIRIVNFLSVDPPPSFSLASQENCTEHSNSDRDAVASVPIAEQLQRNFHSHSRPVVAGLFGSYDSTSRPLESLAEVNNDSTTAEDDAFQDETPENSPDDLEPDAEYPVDTDENSRYDHFDPLEPGDELGNLSMYEDDNDEVVQHALALARVDEADTALRFADLYYASVQENIHQLTSENTTRTSPEEPVVERGNPRHGSSQSSPNLRTRNPEGCPDLRPNARRPIGLSRPNRPRGPSSFSQRVQEKREAHGITESGSVDYTSSDESDKSPQGVQGSYIKRSIDSYNPSNPSRRTSPDSQELQKGGASGREASVRTPNMTGASSSDVCAPAPYQSSVSDTTASASTSASNPSGSRLLPRPPSVAKCLAPVPAFVPTLPSEPASIPVSRYVPRQPGPVRSSEPSGSESSEDGARAASFTPARPKIRPRPGVGDSASSVKDKIRELEERVKAAEQL